MVKDSSGREQGCKRTDQGGCNRYQGGHGFGVLSGFNKHRYPKSGHTNNQKRSFNQNNNGRSITFNIQVQNLLNNTQLNPYSGTMTSPFFGKASSARNPRQIETGLRFNF